MYVCDCGLDLGRAINCALVLAKLSLYPVRILKGGFHRFSALYPFLRTEKILYTITVKHKPISFIQHGIHTKTRIFMLHLNKVEYNSLNGCDL